MTTVRDALRRGAATLAHEDARGEAEILLAHALGADRTALYARPERALGEDERARYDALIAERARGRPVAHLLGVREFRGLALRVTPDVLVPRHETELLVELALERIDPRAVTRIADLGTGSGAIALAIATARPQAHVVAIDVSEEALEVAAGNARALALANVSFRAGDWWSALGGERFDVVVSNPPYLAADDPHLDGELVHEPRSALVAGHDGLDAIRAIARGACDHLVAGGTLIVEHGAAQGAAVRAILSDAGLGEVGTARDLESRERVTSGAAPRA